MARFSLVLLSLICSLGCGKYYSFAFPSGGVTFVNGMKARPSGTLVAWEAGDLGESGRGFSGEGRVIDFLLLPPKGGDNRPRLSFATLGARYTALSFYAEGRRSTGRVEHNVGFDRFYRGPDINVDYQVFGTGVFLRGSFTSWTGHWGEDTRSVYDPFVEGGLWIRSFVPTMIGPGTELNVGVGASPDVGPVVFGKLEFMLGQAVKCGGQAGC